MVIKAKINLSHSNALLVNIILFEHHWTPLRVILIVNSEPVNYSSNAVFISLFTPSNLEVNNVKFRRTIVLWRGMRRTLLINLIKFNPVFFRCMPMNNVTFKNSK